MGSWSGSTENLGQEVTALYFHSFFQPINSYWASVTYPALFPVVGNSNEQNSPSLMLRWNVEEEMCKKQRIANIGTW